MSKLENVEELKTSYPNYTFFLKLRCTSCGESTNKWHDITESERVQIPSRTTNDFNFCIKCKMCGRENSMNIIDKSNGIYQNNDSGKLKTVVVFDCRGVEPYQFLPREGWIVKTIDNGQCFENVDLSEDDWVEYDQKNRNCVGIYEFKSQFVKLKL